MMKTIDIGRLDSSSRKEVLDEVGVLASLHHPHLTAIHECFIEGGYLCLVLQYAEGGNAAGQVEKARRTHTPMVESVILRWFTQAILGLKHLHDKSLAHRDLRTRKLLLTADGHVVLSSAAITPLLRPVLSEERPDLEAMRYLSPEIVSGTEHTAASDMWAMGAILYELASLMLPFDHSHPRGLAERILSGPPPRLPGRCGKDLQTLCASLMQRQPKDRPTSTDVLRESTVHERLCKLFDEEPAFVPGQGAASPRREVAVSPRKGGFGPLLLQSPVAAPRGLRQIGEQVTGIKCGSLGRTGTTTLRTQNRSTAASFSFSEQSAVHTPDSKETGGDQPLASSRASARTMVSQPLHGKSNKLSNGSNDSCSPPEDSQLKATAEMASEHAKAYAGIMIETALEELNFKSSRLLEEDVSMGRFSLPTAVDDAADVSWHMDKVVKRPAQMTEPHAWDLLPPSHSREFPRFS